MVSSLQSGIHLMPEILVHHQERAFQRAFDTGGRPCDLLARFAGETQPPNLSTDLTNHPNDPIWASCFT
jgi:hypothetical protein